MLKIINKIKLLRTICKSRSAKHLPLQVTPIKNKINLINTLKTIIRTTKTCKLHKMDIKIK